MFDTLADLTVWHSNPDSPGTVLDYIDCGDENEGYTSSTIKLANGKIAEITHHAGMPFAEVAVTGSEKDWLELQPASEHYNTPVNQLQSLLEEIGEQ